MNELSRSTGLYPPPLQVSFSLRNRALPCPNSDNDLSEKQSLSPTLSQASSSSNYSDQDSVLEERQNLRRTNTPESRCFPLISQNPAFIASPERSKRDETVSQWEGNSSILRIKNLEIKTIQEAANLIIQRLTQELADVKAEYQDYREGIETEKQEEENKNDYVCVRLYKLMELL